MKYIGGLVKTKLATAEQEKQKYATTLRALNDRLGDKILENEVLKQENQRLINIIKSIDKAIKEVQ